MKFRLSALLPFVLLLVATAFGRQAHAAPTITPLQVRLCDSAGVPRQTLAGEPGYIRLDWRVVGTANAPYTIRFKLAGREMIIAVNSTSPGDWYAYAGWDVVPDGPMPYEIGLDPGNISGDTTPGDNLLLGSVTQTPPSIGVDYFAPRKMFGQQTLTANWVANTGNVQSGYLWLGVPTWESFQQVVDAPGPHYADLIYTTPTSRPVWQSNFGAFSPNSGDRSRIANQKMLVRNYSVRVNPNILNGATWNQVNSLPADIAVWKNGDGWTQTNTVAVQQFVANSLPAQFWTTMTPYETAKKLFRSVVARLSYQTNVVDNRTPDSVLTVNKGDCVSFTCLYVAALRQVGIPARAVTGWWDSSASLSQGIESWHVLVEFYLPGAGWIPADPSASDGANPAGDFAFFFGTNPTMNKFVAVSRGSEHTTSSSSTNYIQGGSCFYWGTSTFQNIVRAAEMAAYVAPNPLGSVRNIAFGPDGRLHLLYRGANGAYSLSFVDNNGTAEYTSVNESVVGSNVLGFAAGPRNQGKMLWRNADNSAGVWTVSSLYEWIRRPVFGPYANYVPANISADWVTNTTRLLWKRNDGLATIWNLDANDNLLTNVSYGPFASWEPISVAALQNAGTLLLWRNTADGTVAIWRLDGNLQHIGSFFFTPPVGWSPMALAVGTDNKPRLVWKHADSRVVLWTLRADFSWENGVEYQYSPGWGFRDVAVDPTTNRVSLLWGHTDGTVQLWKLRPDTQSIETFWWYGAF